MRCSTRAACACATCRYNYRPLKSNKGRKKMVRTTVLATILLSATIALAASPPPSGDSAAEALKKSPRHGEWVDIAAPQGIAFKLHSWVVYPERKDKAPVVIVIHEIF